MITKAQIQEIFMIEKINQILLNNAGQKLTNELINGMALAFRAIVEQEQKQEQEDDVV